MSDPEITDYERYLKIPELLSLQKDPEQQNCPEELLFQVVHQVEELWMKLILQELDRVKSLLRENEVAEAVTICRRIIVAEELMSDQLRLIETLSPRAYFTIRKGLGHGSGQESPGFNGILDVAPELWEPYCTVLERAGVSIKEIQMHPTDHSLLFQLSEALLEIDLRFTRFRYEHLKLVQRVIGGGTDSLKGIPAEVLERSMRHRMFPALWDVREEIFADFTPGTVEE